MSQARRRSVDSYLSLATQVREGGAECEWLLESSASLALDWYRVATCVDIAVVVGTDLLGALLPRRLLFLGRLGLVAATAGRATACHAVLLGLQLRSQARVCILHRGRALGLLLRRLGGRRGAAIIGGAVGRRALIRRRFIRRGRGGHVDIVGARDGIESAFDELLNGSLVIVSALKRRGKDSRCAMQLTFCALRSLPPRDVSRPCRIFFREIVERSAVARIPSIMEV